LEALGLPATSPANDKLLCYLGLLEKWNSAYNLTAIRDPADMVTRHLLDSLVGLPWVRGRVADIGSGAGCPGIALAIMNPALDMTLLDSNGKRIRFLRHVIASVGLNNVNVVHTRAEDYRPTEKFDTLVARAFGSLSELLAASVHLVAAGGRIVAWKGTYPTAEISAVSAAGEYRCNVQRVIVPGLCAERHLLVMTSPR
jgi:16S rRNA (guanine527-N7)-methyltransferase